MIQVQVEVESGAGRFLVSARTESIGRALSLVGAGKPGVTARVVFPKAYGPFSAGEVPDEEGAGVLGPIGSAV